MIGIDIVNLHKFSNKYNSSNNLKKVFSDNEVAYASKKNNPLKTLAGIYAAKEAVIKAFGLNLGYIKDMRIEIIRNEFKQPFCKIDGIKIDCDISISHDGGYAIGICNSNMALKSRIDPTLKKLMPNRKSESHKGDYGRIAILGGSKGMAGSVYMSSCAAMRTGSGLTYIIAPTSISDILQIKSNEQIILPVECDNFHEDIKLVKQILNLIEDKDVLIIGPGMGRGKDLNQLIDEVVKSCEVPVLIDADGLNALSKDLSILNGRENIVLTPHLGEFARLTGKSIEEIKADEENLAKDFASKYSLTLVLKSNKTIVTDGNRIYRNNIGNPGMATAGSGDVLTGVIGTLLNSLSAFDASVLGVYIHSLAGDLASVEYGEDSLIATDIINKIPQAIKLLR